MKRSIIILTVIKLFQLSISFSNAQINIKTYYDTLMGSHIKESYFFKSENEKILHGHYEKYYQTGIIASSGRFTNGLKDSVFSEFYEDGSTKINVTYLNGRKSGLFKSFKKGGILAQKGYFVNDTLCDTVYTYYPSGVLEVKSFFKKGIISGNVETYYPSGKTKQIIPHNNNQANGLAKKFDEDGIHIVSEEQYLNGKKNGKYRQYYTINGGLEEEGIYNEGLKNGVVTSYFTSGQKAFEANYEKGELSGEATSYYENGNKKGEFFNNRDTKKGNYTLFYENGNKKEEVFTNLKEVTIQTNYYSENGILYLTTNFKQYYEKEIGKRKHHAGVLKTGKWKYFYRETGSDSVHVNYIEGKKSGEVLVFYPNKKIKMNIPYLNGYIQGTKIDYNENGQILSEINYIKNNASGLAKYYTDEGVLKREGSLTLGKKYGWWTEYDSKTKKPVKSELYKNDKLIKREVFNKNRNPDNK